MDSPFRGFKISGFSEGGFMKSGNCLTVEFLLNHKLVIFLKSLYSRSVYLEAKLGALETFEIGLKKVLPPPDWDLCLIAVKQKLF